ncbi:putative photosynthetic complex assembly protein PuhE [Rhodocyclus tenuis]|nr:putative photosynthetic complex assembly protein PuhE [Rhodocyclus tenuis]
MTDFAAYGIPAAFAAFVWWSSTGAILFLDGLPRRTFPWSMAGASLLLVFALVGLDASSRETTVTAAYQAFFCAVIVWGWLEMSFLMGFIIGPRRSLSHPPTEGFQRFRNATEAIAYHEFALVIAAAIVVFLTWEAPNLVGTQTFAVLWLMRFSAKLNLFLGVPNLSAELLPEHLSHLRQYLTRRPMNLLFPVSVSAASVVATLLVAATFDATPGSFEATGLALVSTLLVLAILEHWFMVVPLNGAKLWLWSLHPERRSRVIASDLPDDPKELVADVAKLVQR